MALIISNNLVVTRQPEMGQSGLIGYQNLLNVNNVTASSELATNPITNVANPATAYTWESAIADNPGSISYKDTNYMPSPFNPEGWYGGTTDTDGTITNVTTDNPSGQTFVGLAEQTGSTFFIAGVGPNQTLLRGERSYLSIMVKSIDGVDPFALTLRHDGIGYPDRDTRFSSTDWQPITSSADEAKRETLSDGYYLLSTTAENKQDGDLGGQFIFMEPNGASADIGSKCYVQACYFGKNPLEYPYSLYNEFEDTAEVGEWSPTRCNISASGGALSMIGTGSDMYIQTNSMANFDGGKFTHVVTRWKRNTGSISNVLFWANQVNTGFNTTNSIGFDEQDVDSRVVTTGPDQDGFYTSAIDLSSTQSWTGTEGLITSLRFDYGQNLPSDFDIDYIKIYSPSLLRAYEDYWPAVIDSGGIEIDVNTNGQSIDYVGLARHNLNQTGLTVSLKFDGITILKDETVSDIQAIMLLVNEASPDNVQIIINGATNAPQIGVIYVGKALQLERNIYVGHTPITYGRNRKTVNGVSENGQYLGEIVVRQTNMTSVSLQNLTPDWYRSFLDPFFKLTPRVPCFWAWRPEGYPSEVGYCWIEGEPSMSNQRSNGMVEASWQFKGIA